MAFGRKQLGKPTPASVAFNLKLIMAICSAIGAWLGSPNFVPAKVGTVIQSFLLLVIGICIAIEPYFGVTVNSTSVPTKDVKEIEDKPEGK